MVAVAAGEEEEDGRIEMGELMDDSVSVATAAGC